MGKKLTLWKHLGIAIPTHRLTRSEKMTFSNLKYNLSFLGTSFPLKKRKKERREEGRKGGREGGRGKERREGKGWEGKEEGREGGRKTLLLGL